MTKKLMVLAIAALASLGLVGVTPSKADAYPGYPRMTQATVNIMVWVRYSTARFGAPRVVIESNGRYIKDAFRPGDPTSWRSQQGGRRPFAYQADNLPTNRPLNVRVISRARFTGNPNFYFQEVAPGVVAPPVQSVSLSQS